MKHIVRVFGLIALLTGFLIIGYTHRTQAQTLSAGCQLINSGTTSENDDSFVKDKYWNGQYPEFFEGEVITWDLQATSGSSDDIAAVQANFGVDPSQSDLFNQYDLINPGSVSLSGSFTIPSTQTYGYQFNARVLPQIILLDPGSSISASVSCSAPVVMPATGMPVPGVPAIPAFVKPPDNRINWQYGDLNAVIYPDDGDGVSIYCYDAMIDDTRLAFQINPTTVANAPIDRPQSVPVIAINEGGCRIAFYILDSGEFQINLWSAEDKLYEIIADNINFDNSTLRYFDPNE